MSSATEPRPPFPRYRRRVVVLLLLCVAAIVTRRVLHATGSRDSKQPQVFILGDMEKPTGNAPLAHDPDYFQQGTIRLHGAGDEVVAFQAVLRSRTLVTSLDVRLRDFVGPATLPAATCSEVFLAHYVRTADASYSWGEGAAGVMPWRDLDWPDALVPLRDPYPAPDSTTTLVAAPFGIDSARRRNQALWIDVRIPKDSPAGTYASQLEVLHEGTLVTSLPLTLTVHPFNLPAASMPDAFGELYRETGLMFDSGVKFKDAPERDWPIYRRYLQLAHAHGVLAVHRAENGPVPSTATGLPAGPRDAWSDWSRYTPYVDPLLKGTLMSPGEGYGGPRAGEPPAFFPAPFPEFFYGGKALAEHLDAHGGRLDPALLQLVQANAASFWAEVQRNGWQQLPDGRSRRFLAYMMDEVDGPQDIGDSAGDGTARAEQFHRAMADLQNALDAGTSPTHAIALMWTSHSDPTQWSATPADLAPTIRWWAPNARACNPEFIKQQRARAPGQTFWFYHAGQPTTGNHTINQLGIDMRIWGLLCRRYPIDGAFMWSMMSFPFSWNEQGREPYAEPIYRAGETRWGNGVLLYPGTRLPQAGYPRGIAGPVASMRLKAWRRGLQDVAYCRLADARGHRAEVDTLMQTLIPRALSESAAGITRADWSQRPTDYEAMRLQLAQWITEPAPARL